MKRKIGAIELLGFGVTSLGGTLLHYLYDFTGLILFAPFSGVNESTWEHMKLLFWPTFIFAIVQSFFFKEQKDFWCVKVRGALLGLSLIPILFYTYIGIVGKSFDFINIAIFFIAGAIAYFYEWQLFKGEEVKCKNPRLAILTLCIIALLFIVFTFAPPKIGIFMDPISGTYGIS